MKKRMTFLPFCVRLLLIACLLGGSSPDLLAGVGGGQVHVIFKKSNRGKLEYRNSRSDYSSVVDETLPYATNGNGTTYSIIIPREGEEYGDCYLMLKKDVSSNLNKVVFVCASFPTAEQCNRFLNTRPWQYLGSYGGKLGRLIDETNAGDDMMSLKINDAMNGEFLVIEEFDYVDKAVSAEIKIRETPSLEVDGDFGTYSYSPDTGTINTIYKNSANYPILLHVCQPVLQYDPDKKTVQRRGGDMPITAYEVYSGAYWPYGNDPTYQGDFLQLYLPPNSKVALYWKALMDFPTPRLTSNQSLTIGAPIINYTTAISKVSEATTLYNSTGNLSYTLSGAANLFQFIGACPSVLHSNGPHELTLIMGNVGSLKGIYLYESNRQGVIGDYMAEKAISSQNPDGTYTLRLANAFPTPGDGYYLLLLEGTDGTKYWHHFEVSPNVEPVDPSLVATRLVVVQEEDNGLLMTPYEPSSGRTLFTISGVMEKDQAAPDGTIRYNIQQYSLINGVLQLRNDGYNSTSNAYVAKLTWDTNAGTIQFETIAENNGSILAGLYAYGQKVYKTSSGDAYTVSIDLNSQTAYTGTYTNTDESLQPIELKGGLLMQELGVGDLRVSPVEKVKLYLDGFSLSGKAEADCFVPSDLLDAKLDVEDFMFGEYGFMGARGSLTDATLGVHFFGQIGFKAQANVSFDMLPKSRNRHFKVDGKFDLYQMFTATGMLGLVPLDDRYHEHTSELPFDMWIPSSFYAEYNGTIGICDLVLGVGISNMHDADFSNYLINPPSIELVGTLGIGKGPVKVKGTAVLGGQSIGIRDGAFEMGPVELLTELGGMYRHGGKIAGGTTIPWFEISAGGKLDLLSILTGEANIRMKVDLSKSRYGETDISELLKDPQGIPAVEAAEIMYDILDLDYSGSARLAIPDVIPFVGFEANAAISGNKEYIRADADFKASIDAPFAQGSVYGHAWVQIRYYPGLELMGADAYLRSAKNVAPGTPLYGHQYTVNVPRQAGLRSSTSDLPQTITFTSNIIPVQKRKQNIFLRAFGDGYSASATEQLNVDHDKIILRVRSKSDQAGLKLTTPVKDANQDTIYWQTYTAAQLQWKQPTDENGQPRDYYEISIPMSKTAASGFNFTGDWTVETYTADGTQKDSNGEIEIEIYVVLDPETISNIAYAGGNITFDAEGLDPDATYRASFTLMADTLDHANAYSLGVTNEFKGDDALPGFTVPSLNADDFRTLNGSYFIRATLEKYVGDVQVENGTETFRSFEPSWSANSLTAALSYANPNDPGFVTNVTATAIGSGRAKLAWSALDNVNRSGFLITATNASGQSSVFTVADPDARGWEIRARQSVVNATDTLIASLETDRNYAYTVHAYHEFDTLTYIRGAGASPADSLLVPTPVIYTLNTDNFYLSRSGKGRIDIYGGSTERPEGTPAAVSPTVVYAQSKDLLIIGTDAPYFGFRQSLDGVNYTPLQTGIMGGSAANTYTINMNQFTKDTTYQVRALLYDASATLKDTTIYQFRVVIDNTPPDLFLTTIELDTLGQEERRILSGSTEAGASLFLNSEDITASLVGKGFSIELTEPTTLNFKAEDKAGNITTGDYMISADLFSGTDDTKAIRMLTRNGKWQFNLDESGKVNIDLLSRRIDQNDEWHQVIGADVVEWQIVRGGELAKIVKNTDSTSVAYVTGTGELLVMVLYKDLLGDIYLFDIRPYDEAINQATGNNKQSTYPPTTVVLEYKEPTSPNSQPWLRAGIDWKQIEYSCDQIDWTVVPDNAITWYPADSAEIDYGLAGIPACESGVTYFRLNVLEGIDKGVSTVTGIQTGAIPNAVSHIYTVTFTAEGMTPFTEEVAYLYPATIPAEPVRDGYHFDGWHSDAALTTGWNFSNLITGPLTLYGKWTEIFSGGGGDNPTGTDEAGEAGEAGLKVYYTPATGNVTISGLQGSEQITFINMGGRLLLTRQATGATEYIPASHLGKGVYLVRITGENTSEVIVRKLVIN